MSRHLVFNSVDDVIKQRLEAYWSRKLPRLEKLLAPYPADLREIRLTVSHHRHDPQHRFYEVRGVVILPTGTLAAEATDDDPETVLDRIADKLVAEIRGTRARSGGIMSTSGRTATGPISAQPGLNCKSTPRPETGRTSSGCSDPTSGSCGLRPPRDPHAGAGGDAPPRGAVGRRPARTGHDPGLRAVRGPPAKASLDLWLTDLVQDALEQWIKQEPRPHVSLEERAGKFLPDEPPRDDDEEWWAELMGEEEMLRLEDLIPDSEGTEPWTRLEAEEQSDRLLAAIAKLPPVRRQAFLLHALEGYATDEVAMLQDRPESEVKADIEVARKWLKDQLQAEGLVDDDSEGGTDASGGEIMVVATW